jgi:hypothetical protein
MDVLLKLRVLIWILVISLWGVMVYEYLGEEEKESATMRQVVNPYRGINVPSREELPPPAEPASPEGIAAPTDVNLTVAVAAPAAPPNLAERPDPTAFVRPPPEAVAPASEHPSPKPRPAPVRAVRRGRIEDRSFVLPDPPVPPGFQKTATRHFNVYAEQDEASAAFLELIENLHGNLMLDLAPFSPWASDQKVSIFLFKSQETYRRVTGRPPWSGGASSVPKRKVYVYESSELPGILAHELTHIYFDSFFLHGTTDPLWLSEGMATLVQVERGLSAPNWLRDNLSLLQDGEGFPIDKFMNVTTTSGWNDDKVRLWYAQAYSLVRYMIRTQYRSSYYKFAAALRDGRPSAEALYRAYGAPFTRLRALEIAWRHEISRSPTEKSVSGN